MVTGILQFVFEGLCILTNRCMGPDGRQDMQLSLQFQYYAPTMFLHLTAYLCTSSRRYAFG